MKDVVPISEGRFLPPPSNSARHEAIGVGLLPGEFQEPVEGERRRASDLRVGVGQERPHLADPALGPRGVVALARQNAPQDCFPGM